MKISEPTKAQLFCLDDSNRSITFQFNPTSFKFSRKVNWAEGKNAGMPWTTLSFSYGGNDSLNFSLLLDQSEADEEGATNDESVLTDILDFYKLTMPLRVTQGGDEVIRPPLVAFIWEQFQFQGVVQRLDVEMLLFDDTGRPRRAMVTVALLGRALSGASSSEDFFKLEYSPPSASGGSMSSVAGDRLDILAER